MAFYKYFFGNKEIVSESSPLKEESVEKIVENEKEDLVDINSERKTFEFDLLDILDKDFQALGNSDAFSNPNTSYMDLGIQLLNAELETSILNLKGRVVKRSDQIKAWIDMHKGLGQVDSVNRLEAVKVYLQEFVKRINEIESGILENKGESARIVLSYKRGFIKGIEAISYGKYLKP